MRFSIPALVLLAAAALSAQDAPRLPAETLLDRAVLQALDDELSGVAAKDHVSRLTQLHRVPASPGFHEAIEYVMARAQAAGLSDLHVETFPGDGTTWFGTLHGNRGWRVDGGFLDEIRPTPRRITSYDDVRLAVADNSESADVTVELVDAGAGTQRADYAGKDVRGKLVLCDATPSACHRLAVEELGAAGLISYNANQREQRRLRSLSRFVDLDRDLQTGTADVARLSAALADTAKGLLVTLPAAPPRAAVDARVPVRNPAVKGPLAPGGDWLRENAGAGSVSITVVRVPDSDDVTYEIANFVDGTRTVSEIRDAVSAEFEPLELKAVAEYLDLLARAGAVSFKR